MCVWDGGVGGGACQINCSQEQGAGRHLGKTVCSVEGEGPQPLPHRLKLGRVILVLAHSRADQAHDLIHILACC